MSCSSAVGGQTRSCRAVPLDALARDRPRDPPLATIRVAAGQRARRRSRTSTPRGADGFKPRPSVTTRPPGVGACALIGGCAISSSGSCRPIRALPNRALAAR